MGAIAKDKKDSICKVQVALYGGYRFRDCGRPVKEDGLCGIHLGAKKRREANSARWEQERKADDDISETGQALSERVKAIVGESVSSHYDQWNHKITSKMVISREALEKLLDMADAHKYQKGEVKPSYNSYLSTN